MTNTSFLELNFIEEAFSASSPIKSREKFFGRQNEIFEVGRAIMAKGRQVVIYGERGIGKTSLINIVCEEFKPIQNLIIVKHTCSASDTFEDIIYTYLKQTKQLTEKILVEQEYSRELEANANVLFAKGGAKTDYKQKYSYNELMNSNSPNEIASSYFLIDAILVIDEFDRLISQLTKQKLADLIKIVSDKECKTKIVICGVGSQTSELIDLHDSNSRSIKDVKVGRMPDSEIIDILKNGFNLLKINASSDLLALIAKISDGAPYFAHFFGEELSAFAIGESISSLAKSHFFDILPSAIENISPNIVYRFNTISQKHELEEVNHDQEHLLPSPGIVRQNVIIALSFKLKDMATEILYSELCAKEIEKIGFRFESLSFEEIERVLMEISDNYHPLHIREFTDRAGITVRIIFYDQMLSTFCWMKASVILGKQRFLEIFENNFAQQSVHPTR